MAGLKVFVKKVQTSNNDFELAMVFDILTESPAVPISYSICEIIALVLRIPHILIVNLVASSNNKS
jgi:hypothetical protein